MARVRGFEVECINIRVHTRHDPAEYTALWRAVGRQRMPLIWRTGIALMIGESVARLAPNTEGFYGQFYRFVQINENDQWFDISQHKPADAEDVAKVSIPPNLRPNLHEFPYYFDVIKHRLYFVSKIGSKTLNASAVDKLIDRLVTLPSIHDRFGPVDHTVATESEAVEKLLAWPVLTRVTVEVERPNPTDEADEEAVFNRLDKMGVKTERQTYLADESRPTIRPDADLQLLARVAANHGEVEVAGRDHDGRRRTANSQEFRLTLKRVYDTGRETLTEGFMRVVGDMFPRRL